jgi:Xaa-Pro dipeptidase
MDHPNAVMEGHRAAYQVMALVDQSRIYLRIGHYSSICRRKRQMLFNCKRAQEFMRQYQLDALVATSPVNITYFSDYYCWLNAKFKEYMEKPGAPGDLQQGYAVYPLVGEPALIVTPIFAVNAADIWVRDLHFFGDPGFDKSIESVDLLGDYRVFLQLLHGRSSGATPTDALFHVLEKRGLEGGQIGLEMESLPKRLREQIRSSLPRAKIKDCSNLLRLIRMVKSGEELSHLRRSAEINEQAAMESLLLARPGRSVRDLTAHFRTRVAELGADFDHFAFGIRGLGIATEPNYILRNEDVLFVDFGCSYQNYFSDSGTTLAIGAMPKVLHERHSALRACVTAAAEAIKPGVRASIVRDAMWKTLNERGITASFPHGHGLGLEVRDYPIVVADNGLRIQDECVSVASDLSLESDMVINLESAIFAPGTGSVHIEKSFLVTPDGNSPLIVQDRSSPVQA